MKRRILPLLLLLGLVYALTTDPGWLKGPGGAAPVAEAGDGNAAIARAFKDRRSDVQVQGAGQVVRVLSDDNHGSRHQRFVLDVGEGHTVLIAHNIDLAPRVAGLKTGDTVSFFGEYEWNDQGGVVHWTHRDIQGRHADGWLKHEGKTYD